MKQLKLESDKLLLVAVSLGAMLLTRLVVIVQEVWDGKILIYSIWFGCRLPITQLENRTHLQEKTHKHSGTKHAHQTRNQLYPLRDITGLKESFIFRPIIYIYMSQSYKFGYRPVFRLMIWREYIYQSFSVDDATHSTKVHLLCVPQSDAIMW